MGVRDVVVSPQANEVLEGLEVAKEGA